MSTGLGDEGGFLDRDVAIRALRSTLQEMTWSSLRVQSRLLGEFGLTSMQELALKALLTSSAPLDMARISELTALPPSTVTNVVDRLERDGLAQRQRHATDRRKVLVVLTEAGRQMLGRLDEMEMTFTADLLSNVPDGDLLVLIEAFRGMMRQLESFDADPDLIRRMVDQHAG